jgi:hypothetical protein
MNMFLPPLPVQGLDVFDRILLLRGDEINLIHTVRGVECEGECPWSDFFIVLFIVSSSFYLSGSPATEDAESG